MNLEAMYEEYVTFSGTGTYPNKMAYCPLHGEVPGKSKPSLCVNVETGAWICFAGCGGGTAKSFLTSLGENKHVVRDKTKDIKPVKKRKKTASKQSFFLPTALLGLFDECPLKLVKAGFDEEVLQYHDIGFDYARNRITYPVFTREGNLLAIVGRRPTSEFGKYVPYTEKELTDLGVVQIPKYEKGSVFWREDKFFQTKACHDRTKPVILVEGFKAALWLVQAGYNNVMALMGTHLTDAHVHTLEGLGKTVILCLDGDKPGIVSTVKNSYKLSRTLKVLICNYPGGATQPDDLQIQKLNDMIQKPITITKFKRIHKTILGNTHEYRRK